MSRQRRHFFRKRALAEINVVPYIDVMLVLLIIFMITAPLLMQGVQVNLPQTSSKPLSPKEALPIIVSIDQQGRYFLNTSLHPQQPISAQNLMSDVSAILSSSRTPRPLYVKGDRNVDYGKVVTAMSLLQKAGAQNVGLITQP